MVTVGFHSHWLNGIDCIGVNQHKDYPEYELPITVAIVMSGMYEDDVDKCADVVYTGQGGNNLLGNKRQIGLTYITSLQFANNVIPPSGCNCKGSCTDPKSCACASLNGVDFPYVHRDGGRLIEPKGVVYECGPKCACGPNCVNKTTQRG
nr:histone-lysine N-methyltransferase, H3 lysine-9 specific SUVH4 isoform X1 [Tanacetum cinerariifolium]